MTGSAPARRDCGVVAHITMAHPRVHCVSVSVSVHTSASVANFIIIYMMWTSVANSPDQGECRTSRARKCLDMETSGTCGWSVVDRKVDEREDWHGG